MAKRKKQKIVETKNSKNSSGNKQKKIWGVILLTFSLILFLSIVSYSWEDLQFSDLPLLRFFKELFENKLELKSHNLLGLIGSYIASNCINNTLGYFSLIFPVIISLIGYSFFQKIDSKKLINFFSFIIAMALLLSTLLGTLSKTIGFYNRTLYGTVGEFLGDKLISLLGGVGSILLLLASIIVVLIIYFDLKIEKIFEWLKSIFTKSVDFAKVKINESRTREKDTDTHNLEKIKELGKQKKKIILPPVEIEEPGEEDEEPKETKIRIIRKDKPEQPLPVEEIIPEIIPGEEELKSEEPKKERKKEPESELASLREHELNMPEPWDENIDYVKPSLELLDPVPNEDFKVAEDELKRNAELLKDKLSLFDIEIQDISVTPGPVVTLYEIVPAPGVKISRIVSLEHDIALALAAKGIRIIAPIPGKSAIGVEIPNSEPSLVVARSVLSTIEKSNYELPLALGKTIAGDTYITDLSKMPHLLIAGSTGSGKSVGINMIISSLIYSKHPAEVKFAIIDPKKIELSFYNNLRKHFLAVSPDLDEEIITAPQNAVLLLKSIEFEMEQRYDRLAKAGVRNIVDYNQRILDPERRPKDSGIIKHHYLPYIVIIIDELADLMITAGKEVEEPIARLAQLARAVGIHLVLATQRPSVNVITGVIKANFGCRMAYQVATKIDSRTILDMNGAEQLLGRGDMLFLPGGMPKPIRIQNAFISSDEVERITDHIFRQPGFSKPYYLPSLYDKKKESAGGFLNDLDPLFEEAAKMVVRYQQGSVSLLQRRLKLGYSRAARIVDQLEEAGIVGPGEGSKAREVIVENDEQLETILRSL
jgi:S-DNA-T family DNA segregation ATPase FtsK/SpoIIIE